MKATNEINREMNRTAQAERRAKQREVEKAKQRDLDGDLTLWADVIVYRGQNPGSLWPADVMEGVRKGDGTGFPAVAYSFWSVDDRIQKARVPRCVQAIWLRQYGGSDLRRLRGVIEELYPCLDSEEMAKTVRMWRKSVINREDNGPACNVA